MNRENKGKHLMKECCNRYVKSFFFVGYVVGKDVVRRSH